MSRGCRAAVPLCRYIMLRDGRCAALWSTRQGLPTARDFFCRQQPWGYRKKSKGSSQYPQIGSYFTPFIFLSPHFLVGCLVHGGSGSEFELWVSIFRKNMGMRYGSIPINTIFSGMNIHLPAILGFTRGTRVLTHPHIPRKSAGQSDFPNQLHPHRFSR